jgi:hypothetical protein
LVPHAQRRILLQTPRRHRLPAPTLRRAGRAGAAHPGPTESDQVSPPGEACCFSSSVSRSPSACQRRAACALLIAIRTRVSRSTDDLASLVPRNVMRMLPVPSSLWTSGAQPEAIPTSRTRRSYVSFPYSKSRQRVLTQVTIRVVARSGMSRGRLRAAPAVGPTCHPDTGPRCASRC